MIKAAIIQSNYIPWKGYFDIINDVDVFCFYDEVKYTKNDWRNRNKIYSKNGLHWITIPIPKDAVRLKISEVIITDKSWQEQHYKMLMTTYGGAPYFSQLEYFMNELFVKNKWENLSELNQFSIKLISEYIGIKTEFVNSKGYKLSGNRVERLINLVKDLGGSEYISGPSAKDYLQNFEHLFEENNIKLTYKEYPVYPDYKQLRLPFEHFVSILDLIANIEQNEILKYMKPMIIS
jgi:hypothetical protein